ncbi:MAG: hypothetical protein OXO49_09070 [Gammaproteobacteria bacterium]|nr:hypothetical protein [Gammaproteobacteria bacterium]MDE0252731.1 hypothetical protein [Gammaproteobacteria bacterium]MDE0402254.1 hypothetical protein [Gammaproteobacteria bacterium]
METSGEDKVIVRVTLTVEPEDDMFFGTCKEFPGVLVNGVSEQDCLDRTRVAINSYLEICVSKGIPFPDGVIIRDTDEPPIRLLEDIRIPAVAA